MLRWLCEQFLQGFPVVWFRSLFWRFFDVIYIHRHHTAWSLFPSNTFNNTVNARSRFFGTFIIICPFLKWYFHCEWYFYFSQNIVFDTISEVTTNTHTVKPRYFKLDGTEKKLPKYPRIRDIEGKIFNK